MSEGSPAQWICSQLGSREHYAIPRVLSHAGRLRLMLTDFWARPGKLWHKLLPGTQGAKLRQRFHPELANAKVEDLGFARLAFDFRARFSGLDPWETIMRRNAFFQEQLLARQSLQEAIAETHERRIFFTYSYAGGRLMECVKARGWKIILGQIDPGEQEQRVVANEHLKNPDSGSSWLPAPQEYWHRWKQECDLSDLLVVNSQWSAESLEKQGIPPDRIRVIPLAFETDENIGSSEKVYPRSFTAQRPLRVLFLGQVILRKGVHLALEAARILKDRPVEWWFIGPTDLAPPADDLDGRISWRGPVSRQDSRRLYTEADVFLLPTLSDGFALTQLEAQAARLPLLASRFCGNVVRDGTNGLLIDPLDAKTIANRVQQCLEEPSMLARFSQASSVAPQFSMGALETNLLNLETELFATNC